MEKKSIVISAFALVAGLSLVASQNSFCSAYDSVLKDGKMPEELHKKVDGYFKERPLVWQAVVQQPRYENEPFHRDTVMKKYKRAGAAAQKHFLHSNKSTNFICDFPGDKEFLMKISGAANRDMLQVANQDKPYGQFGKVDTTRLVPTYQTMSRVFHNALIKQAKDEQDLKNIEVVQKYVYCGDNGQNKPEDILVDENCVVLSKKAPVDLLSDLSSMSFGKFFNKNTIPQVIKAAKHAGLWNLTKTKMGVDKSGNIYFLDTEQPNTMKPDQAFNKCKKRLGHSRCCAVQTLYKCFPKKSEQRKIVEAYVANDPEILGACNIKDFLNLTEQNKN